MIGVGVASQHIGAFHATPICAAVITTLVALALLNIARSPAATQADLGV